jgi:hypothetical protein
MSLVARSFGRTDLSAETRMQVAYLIALRRD